MSLNNLTYQRLKTAQGLIQNRLYSVNDNVDENNFDDDIDDQGAFNNTPDNVNLLNNYAYDELGNLTKNTQKEIAEIKWTVYGKVQEVIRTNGSSKKNLKYEYNATGQRTVKHVYNSEWRPEYSDYYVYDALGNMMSIYRLNVDEQQQTASFALTERPIYGSSRIGSDKSMIEFIGYTPPTTQITNHILGLKQYTGSNHLGNILTTFSDKKMPVDENNDGTIDYYNADVTSSTDFYPFGVTMKARDFSSNVSRFGFNGMEEDDETETMDFGARLLDGDLGLWLALDPLAKEYASWSPYKAMMCNPIIFSDYGGSTDFLTIRIHNKNTGKSMALTRPTSEFVYMGSTVMKQDCFGRAGYYHVNEYYDRQTVIDVTIDGSSISNISLSTQLLKDRPRATTYGDYRANIIKVSDSKEKYQKGGLYLTSIDGGFDPTQFKSINEAERVEIDQLLATLGNLGKAKYPNLPKGVNESLLDIINGIKNLVEVGVDLSNANKNSNIKSEERRTQPFVLQQYDSDGNSAIIDVSSKKSEADSAKVVETAIENSKGAPVKVNDKKVN